MIGWSKAEGLLDEKLSREDFREIIHKEYFPQEKNRRRSGQVAGDLWRFIRVMGPNNYVLIPTKDGFYIGKITGPATYDEMKIFSDTAYRRKIEWLNDKKPVSKDLATEDLQKKLKTILSIIDASVLYQEIEFALRHA